jgi:hypothetical protein
VVFNILLAFACYLGELSGGVANDDYYYYDGGAPATGGEGRR